MNFNSDPSKDSLELIFTRKVKKGWTFTNFLKNEKPFRHFFATKHLGFKLDTSLTFDEHIKAIKSKVSKTIGLLQKLNNCLPQSSLTKIYKLFLRPHLDYGDVIFDNIYIKSSHQRLESL